MNFHCKCQELQVMRTKISTHPKWLHHKTHLNNIVCFKTSFINKRSNHEVGGNYRYIVSDFDANIDIKFMLNDRLGEYR